ncbi:enoyl-CoA hydratase domain-containing protein 3, mitochondrial-like [Argonauta hians]
MAALLRSKCLRLVPIVRHGAGRLYSSGTQAEPILLKKFHPKGIVTLTLNNPTTRNALCSAMLEKLFKELQSCSEDRDVRVVLITANGRVFSSGHDLKELVITDEHSKQRQIDMFRMCSEVMNTIQDMAVPVIAQVSGLATAAGCQLVASCDIVIASHNAKFAVPGVNIGLFCTTPGVALGRAVPRKVAMEMLLTGRPISAQVALQYGLVSRIVSDEELEGETMKVADRICESSRSVLALGKSAFDVQMSTDRSSAYYYAEKIMVCNLCKADAQEGVAAFLKKRKPRWTNE